MAAAEPGLKTYWLEQRSAAKLRAPSWPVAGAGLHRVVATDGAFNRQMYRAVGAQWQWHDKQDWSAQQWREYAHTPGLLSYEFRCDDESLGYGELLVQAAGAVQIAYFGLLPAAIGRGLGGASLGALIAEAWSWPETRRVWVHTCSLDHPAALANYQARGMRLLRTTDGAA